jgi:hypothetical protein
MMARMGSLIPVNSICLAEYGVIKGMAVVAFGVVAYLYWSELREKRERRRQQRALEERRRMKGGSLPPK